MPTTRPFALLRRAVICGAIVSLSACGAEHPTALRELSEVRVHAITPATIRSLIVEVTGPGVDPAVLVNLPVGADSAARGTIIVPAGSARRFVVTAVDTAGIATHRGDTTLALPPGLAAPLAIQMRPIPSSVTLTVTFGSLELGTPQSQRAGHLRVPILTPE